MLMHPPFGKWEVIFLFLIIASSPYRRWFFRHRAVFALCLGIFDVLLSYVMSMLHIPVAGGVPISPIFVWFWSWLLWYALIELAVNLKTWEYVVVFTFSYIVKFIVDMAMIGAVPVHLLVSLPIYVGVLFIVRKVLYRECYGETVAEDDVAV